MDARTFDHKLKYPKLLKVVGCVMSLPASNAALERLFSVLKLVKTDTRNSLKRESLVGVIHTKEGLRADSCPANKLSMNAELLRRLKGVKSNATDDESHELIMQELSS